jgi:hypothetical protein
MRNLQRDTLEEANNLMWTLLFKSSTTLKRPMVKAGLLAIKEETESLLLKMANRNGGGSGGLNILDNMA